MILAWCGRGLACEVMAKTDVILTPDQRVRVFISSTLEELAPERAAARRVEPVDAQTCVLSCGANNLDEIVVWVALMDIGFEVHDPPELAERVGVMADRLRAASATTGR